MVQIAPTMLIGVGGTGCEIADRISTLVQSKNLDVGNRLVIIGFDTDENDMKKRKSLSPRRRVRFSSKLNIFQLMTKLKPFIDDWFAADTDLTTEIRQMSLMDGAGQIRMLTRLSLFDALSDPQVSADIDAAASAIAKFGGQSGQFAGNVNVLLVGSLAGATGSGSFLQVSLMIADRLREKGMQPHVRGLFLLPEVFTRAARLPTGQIPNVLANGYAALRELNAMVLKTAGRTDKDFHFEYAPGCHLKPDGLPLRSMALIDYENSVGGNLGTDYDAYKEMAVRAAYTMVFTPIGDRVSSVSVNDAQAAMAAAATDQTRCFAGVGVSAIRYPRAENLRYLSLRYASTTLEGDWLRLNRSFEAKMTRYEEERRSGQMNLEAPQVGPTFVEDLRRLALQDRVPFFRRIHTSVFVERVEEKGDVRSEELHITYLDALQNYMLRAFWSATSDLQNAATRQALDDSKLEQSSLVARVRDCETALDRDWIAVETGVLDKPDDIYVNGFQGGEAAPPADWQPHHIQSFVLRLGWHPVAVRYFLYCLRAEIARRQELLNPKHFRKGVLSAAARFDDKHNTDKDAEPRRGTPKVRQKAEEATKNGMFGLSKSGFRQFVSEYTEYFASSQKGIRAFGEQSVLARLYDRLDRDLDHICGVFEAFFRDISALQAKIGDELLQMDRARSSFDGSLLVWGNQRARDAMWEELSPHLAGEDDNSKVNSALDSALLERYRLERGRRIGGKLPPFDGRILFQQQIIEGYCAETIHDRFANVYSMSVVAAIRREAESLERDWRQYFDELVQTVGYQARPFLAFHDDNAGQRIMFWAISPRNREEIGDEAFYNELFSRNQGERPLCEAEFPDEELMCFNARVNLFLTDLRKLHPGDRTSTNIAAVQQGIYDREYRAKIARILEDKRRDPNRPTRDFTPHLDREWHKPGILPEIFGDDPGERRLQWAVVTGFALGLLPRADEGGVTVTYARLWEHRGTSRHRERLQVGGQDEDLVVVLRSKPEVVTSLIEAAADNLAKDATERPVADARESALYQGLVAPATLARILAVTVRRSQRQDKMASELATVLFEEIRGILARTQLHLEEWHRTREAALTVKELAQKAMAVLDKGEALRPETLAGTREMIESLVKKIVSDWGTVLD